jgi:hypothetical protein
MAKDEIDRKEKFMAYTCTLSTGAWIYNLLVGAYLNKYIHS